MKFIKWLHKQRKRKDDIGLLATANYRDGNTCGSYACLLDYLVDNRVGYEFITCLKKTKKEYTAVCFPKLRKTK